MVRIKICGNTNLKDSLKAVELGVHALGFIFACSPRKIQVVEAKHIINNIPSNIEKIGVFVNENEKKIKNIANHCNLDTLQFHGNESLDFCKKFKNLYRIIKTIRIKDKKSLEKISEYISLDAVLLDTFTADKYGGTGKCFDWNLAFIAKKYNVPLVLAGGLNPDNIIEAIKKIKPYMVDVCSGIEKEPGLKDYKMMENFVARINQIYRVK